MYLSIVQFQPNLAIPGEGKINQAISANRQKIYKYCVDIQSDIIVFPELALSGYCLGSRDFGFEIAETRNDETYQNIQHIASKSNKIIIYGFPEKDHDKLFNSAAIIFPDATLSAIYRKTHLFLDEKNIFDKGDTGFFCIKDSNLDINIGTLICYDWRFPESARTLGMQGADLIVMPSNLITHIWPKVMPARAIENKVYVAVANRIGIEKNDDDNVEFNGLSAVWSYNGDLLAVAGPESEEVITVEIHPEETRNKRINRGNHIIYDRRPEMYFTTNK